LEAEQREIFRQAAELADNEKSGLALGVLGLVIHKKLREQSEN